MKSNTFYWRQKGETSKKYPRYLVSVKNEKDRRFVLSLQIINTYVHCSGNMSRCNLFWNLNTNSCLFTRSFGTIGSDCRNLLSSHGNTDISLSECSN